MGSRPAGVSAIRYQTPLNLLIGRRSFANYERVTDSLDLYTCHGGRGEAFFQAGGFPSP
jgi:hypothetical protein